ATGGHGVEPGVAAAPRPRDDVVDGGGVAAAVGAAPAVAQHHAAPGPGRSGVVPPPGHDVLDEPYDLRDREDADEYVRLRFVHDRDLAEEHAYGVAEADPVQRPEVGVEDENGVHRFTSFGRLVVDFLERLRGVEPRSSP